MTMQQSMVLKQKAFIKAYVEFFVIFAGQFQSPTGLTGPNFLKGEIPILCGLYVCRNS